MLNYNNDKKNKSNFGASDKELTFFKYSNHMNKIISSGEHKYKKDDGQD